jgi:hypothetical protein
MKRDDFRRIWKETVMANIVGYCPSICLEELGMRMR